MIQSEPLNRLADAITANLRVELSDEGKAELAQARKRYPNEELSKSKPLYKFTTAEQDAHWERYSRELAEWEASADNIFD